MLWGLAALVLACDGIGGGSETSLLPLEDDTVRLGPGVERIDVVLRAARHEQIGPDTVRLHSGDMVRFIAGDAMTHAVVFDAAPLSAEARAFLERTGQLRGPPLVESGSAWIVSFEDAPAGVYPFNNLAQGTRGVLRVESRR